LFCSGRSLVKESLASHSETVRLLSRLGVKPYGRYTRTLARAIEHVVNATKPSFSVARRELAVARVIATETLPFDRRTSTLSVQVKQQTVQAINMSQIRKER